MRYVTEGFLESTLRRGRSLEQFLGACPKTDGEYILCLEIRPANDQYEVWRHKAEDLGDEDCLDFYEYIVYEDEEGNEIGPLSIWEKPDEALAYAEKQLGASRTRWTNLGVAQDEYEDFIKAGRPSFWPPC